MVFKNESINFEVELTEFCIPGTTYTVATIDINPHVALRVITFSPKQTSTLPKILFIPGWITHIQSWQAVLYEMTKSHEVVYLETREKVSSKVNADTTFSIDAIGADVIEFVKSTFNTQDEFVIFASSLGATLALEISQQLNPKPKAMALVAPNAVFRVPLIMKLFVYLMHPALYLMAKPVVKKYLKHFRLDTEKDLAQYHKYCRALDSADPRKLKKAAIAFWNYSVWHRLPHILTPTLIIGASKDKLHEPENLILIAQQLPNATYIDLETNAAAHQAEAVHALYNFLKML